MRVLHCVAAFLPEHDSRMRCWRGGFANSVAAGIRDPASITLTDQDSIRRRYTALDVANPDGIAAINPKTLFKSTFILDYVAEDSPTNRKKMQTMVRTRNNCVEKHRVSCSSRACHV
jgi:hypothetical protein